MYDLDEKTKQETCIDYFKFTLPTFLQYDFLKFMGISDNVVSNQNRRKGNYANHYTILENIQLLVDGPVNADGFSVMQFEMSGQGCREFERFNLSWSKLIDYCVTKNANVTRLDIAYDVYHTKYFDMKKLKRKVSAKEYTSPSQGKEFKVKEDSNGKKTMDSFYIGSQSSNMCINIYDKNLERSANNIETWVNDWIRIELRLKREKSNKAVRIMHAKGIENLATYSNGMLRSSLDFKVGGSKDSNMSRRKTCKWWNNFLNSEIPINLSGVTKEKSTIATKKDWKKRSVSLTDYSLFLSSYILHDDGRELLDDMFKNMYSSREKFTNKHKTMLYNDLESKGLLDKLKGKTQEEKMIDLEKKISLATEKLRNILPDSYEDNTDTVDTEIDVYDLDDLTKSLSNNKENNLNNDYIHEDIGIGEPPPIIDDDDDLPF